MKQVTDSSQVLPGITKQLFLKLGVLPFFLAVAVVIFSVFSDNFLSGQNLLNVARQSVYLVLVSSVPCWSFGRFACSVIWLDWPSVPIVFNCFRASCNRCNRFS